MIKLRRPFSYLLEALGCRNKLPFELRIATNPDLIDDVHGRAMSRHASLAEAIRWRRRYYKMCVTNGVTPVPLATVEVRRNCVVRYIGKMAYAVYGKGINARVESLREEMTFRVEDVLAL